MIPKYWGPCIWETIHRKTFELPKDYIYKDILSIRKFFLKLSDILLCDICVDSYNTIIKYIDPRLFIKSRIDAIYYGYTIHNIVNLKTGKDIFTADKFAKKYGKILDKKDNIIFKYIIEGKQKYDSTIINIIKNNKKIEPFKKISKNFYL